MKTLLTRIGYNSKFIISGDLDQSDRYSDIKKSGLYDGVDRHKNIQQFGFMEFDESDIVRNPLISLILDNYKKVVSALKGGYKIAQIKGKYNVSKEVEELLKKEVSK